MKGKFIPEIQGENVSYPGKKKYPDLGRPEIKFPNPTQPENILKNVPIPRTGFGSVRSGPVRSGEVWGFKLPSRSLWRRGLKGFSTGVRESAPEKSKVKLMLYTGTMETPMGGGGIQGCNVYTWMQKEMCKICCCCYWMGIVTIAIKG